MQPKDPPAVDAQALPHGVAVLHRRVERTDARLIAMHEAAADVNDQITVVWVPGAFEIPLVAKKLATSKTYAAVICLSTIIRGQTDHYDYVCGQISKGVGEVGLTTEVPTMFGVVTCDTLEQAIDRAGAKGGNVGADAASGAIEMVSVLKQLAN